MGGIPRGPMPIPGGGSALGANEPVCVRSDRSMVSRWLRRLWTYVHTQTYIIYTRHTQGTHPCPRPRRAPSAASPSPSSARRAACPSPSPCLTDEYACRVSMVRVCTCCETWWSLVLTMTMTAMMVWMTIPAPVFPQASFGGPRPTQPPNPTTPFHQHPTTPRTGRAAAGLLRLLGLERRHVLVVVQLHVLLVLPPAVVLLPPRRRVVCQVRLAVVAEVARHGDGWLLAGCWLYAAAGWTGCGGLRRVRFRSLRSLTTIGRSRMLAWLWTDDRKLGPACLIDRSGIGCG